MSDRKYRQRGYREEEGVERRRPGGPAPRREGPRGRGLGKPTATVFRCAVCGQRQPTPATGVAVCEACGTALHSCTHCAHFEPTAPLECRQPITESIASKSKQNDCGLFEPRLAQEFEAGHERPDDARAAFDDLFDL